METKIIDLDTTENLENTKEETTTELDLETEEKQEREVKETREVKEAKTPKKDSAESKRDGRKAKRRVVEKKYQDLISLSELKKTLVDLRGELEDEYDWRCKALGNDAIFDYTIKIFKGLGVEVKDDKLVADTKLVLSDRKIQQAGEDLQDGFIGLPYDPDDEEIEIQQMFEDVFSCVFSLAPDYGKGEGDSSD